MHWHYYLYITGLILVIILLIFYIIGKKLQVSLIDLSNTESFENPLEISKDLIDKLYAKIYDKVFDEPEVFKEEAKEILKFMEKHRIEGSEILDVGTGTGKHFQNLSSSGIKVIGVDRSEAMLDIFKFRNPLGKYILGDIKNEGLFPGQKFKIILCLKETLYHNKMIDWDTIFSNFFYWLKPNGYLVIHIFDRELLDSSPRNMSFGRKDGEGRMHGITNFPNFTHDGWWEKRGKVICQYNEIIAMRDKKGTITKKKHYKHNLVIPEKRKIIEKIMGNYFKIVEIVKLDRLGLKDHELYFFKKIK
jgi:SAM-dependent methyltransferase